MPNTHIPLFKPFLPKSSIDLVDNTLHTSWIGGDGPRVKDFEETLKKIVQNNNLMSINSGTSALHLALRLAGVSGGEVISTPMTCVATNVPIVNEGADIVWSDINSETGSIDPTDIEKKISKRTRAIMIVDWGGFPCDINQIKKIGKNHNIPIIEDAAQALGSIYKKKPIGSHVDYVAFSTQAIKIINTVDGGFLATKTKKDIDRAKILRWYGIDRDKRVYGDTFWDYPIKEAGFKMQMTDMNASVGLGQIPFLNELVSHRKELAEIYMKAIDQSKTLHYQRAYEGAEPNYWMFTVLCDNPKNRVKLWGDLKKIDVESGEAHIRNDLYPVFKKYNKGTLAGVTKFNNEKLIIPNGYWVTKETAGQIAQVLASF